MAKKLAATAAKKSAARSPNARSAPKSRRSGVAKKFNVGAGGPGLRSALSQGNPGAWATDHREETNHFTGWNYVALRQIALQCSQAEVFPFQNLDQPQKAYIKEHGCRAFTKRHLLPGGRLLKANAKAYGGDEQSDGEALPADHRLVRLQKRPNPNQSGASFRYEQAVQLGLTGTCLVWNVPNKFGLTVERYVVPTAIAYPQPPSRDLPGGAWRINPQSSYLRDADGFVAMLSAIALSGGIIPAERMQVIRWPHPLVRDDGYSSLAAGALWSDSADQIDKTRWYQMNQGADPSVVIPIDPSVDVSEEELDRASEKANKKYGGPKNAGKIMFAYGGRTPQVLSTAPRQMAYGEAFIQLRDALLALHGYPKGMIDAGSYASLYAALKQFILLAVQPLLCLLAEEDTEQLAPEFGPGLTIEMEAASVNDEEVLERQLATDVSAGAITVDELRALRGRSPLGGEAGGRIAGALGQPQSATSQQGPPEDKPPAVGLNGEPAGVDLGGEFGSLSRLQWTRNRRATQDVLDEVGADEISDTMAIETLVSLGWSRARAERLVEDARDGEYEVPVEGDVGGEPKRSGFRTVAERLAVAYP